MGRLVLLTGASGGGRLLPALEARGHRVRCLARRPAHLVGRAGSHTEVVRGDVLDPASLTAAMRDVDTAYYLVHAMGSAGSFEEEDREAAGHFGRAAREAGVRRIVYLGGLGEGDAALSPHLRSRHEVGEVLRQSGVQVIEFRASIVIGSGSLSFVLDPALLGSREHASAARRRGFLFAGLRALDAALRQRGGRLVVLRGQPARVLRQLLTEVGASAVVAEEDYSPYARRRDAAVARAVPLVLVTGVSVHHPRDVVKSDGRPYTVYTPYARAWQALPSPHRRGLLAAPAAMPPLPRNGDPAANNGGWQWVAGTGTDAAPYFRIFNPLLQARRYDPEGAYVRRWVPELARVPAPMVHEPWRLTPLEQKGAGLAIGRDYPMPVVDHGVARARTLAAYARARASK